MAKRINTAKWMETQKRWQVNVQKDGVRRSFTSSKPGRTGQREANAKADAWLDEGITGGNKRIDQLYNDYINYLKETATISNWRPAESKGRTWILPAIGKKKISMITEHDLQRIIDTAYHQKRSRKTLMNIRATLVNFFKYCKRNRYPIPDISEIKIPQGAHYKGKKIVQPEDLRALFRIDTTILNQKRQFEKYIYAFRFQVLTGLRPGEMIGLRWGDIKGAVIRIQRSVNIYGEVTSGKNQNAIRSFRLNLQAQKVLEDQKTLTDSFDPNASIFEITSAGNYLKRWKKYCISNQIPPTSVYELRHTFVSVAKNLSDGQIRPLVGHSSNMDTYGIYSHEVSGDSEKTAMELEHIFARYLADPDETEK